MPQHVSDPFSLPSRTEKHCGFPRLGPVRENLCWTWSGRNVDRARCSLPPPTVRPSGRPAVRPSPCPASSMPAIRGQDSKKKTRRHTRDLDQIHADLRDDKHLAAFKDATPAEDLPGLGQHYCKECAKFFESEANRVAHTKGKVHKRR